MTISPSEPVPVIRRVVVEATGGHHELQAIASAVAVAVRKLRDEADRDQRELTPVSFRPLLIRGGKINLEGTIKIETEEGLG